MTPIKPKSSPRFSLSRSKPDFDNIIVSHHAVIESQEFQSLTFRMRSKGHSKKSYNKFVRCLKAPFQALRKARDGYIQILTSCASSIDYGYCPSHFPGQNHELPRSYNERSSATSNVKEEAALMELIRATSVTSSSRGNETDEFSPKQLRAKMRSRGLPENMGRIDEDKPCEFEDNNVVIVERRRKFGIKFQRQESIPVYVARA